jgi:hypothetical protein
VSKKLKTAVVLFYILAGIACAYGCIYLLIPTLLPYHQKYIEKPFTDLPPKVQSLFMLIYRGVGVAMIALGLTLIMIVKGFFSKGSRWAWWTILVEMGTVLIPTTIIAYTVGPYTPWWGIGILVLVMAYALYISWKETS